MLRIEKVDADFRAFVANVSAFGRALPYQPNSANLNPGRRAAGFFILAAAVLEAHEGAKPTGAPVVVSPRFITVMDDA